MNKADKQVNPPWIGPLQPHFYVPKTSLSVMDSFFGGGKRESSKVVDVCRSLRGLDLAKGGLLSKLTLNGKGKIVREKVWAKVNTIHV